MELTDLVGLSQPITKLLDVIQAGCNFVLKPNYLKRIERAKLDMEKERDKYQMEKRIKDFLLDQAMNGEFSPREQRQMKNVSDVYAYAAAELTEVGSVADEPVHTDWSARFFDCVKDVSDDDIKIIWGKILAGEIKSPGTYSKSTLNALWNLDAEDASAFVRLCGFAVSSFIPALAFDSGFDEYDDLLSVSACGLIVPVACECKIAGCDDFSCGGRILEKTQTVLSDIVFEGYPLTRAGLQLIGLVQITENMDYIQKVKQTAERTSHQTLELK